MLQNYDPRNQDILININGKLLHRDQAGISPFDSAVQGGDAVWEGLRLYGGCIFRLTAHLDRLRHSAQALAFGDIPSQGTITREIARTLEANKMRDGVHIRLTLTRGVKVTSGMDPRLNRSGPTLIQEPPGRKDRLMAAAVSRRSADTTSTNQGVKMASITTVMGL